MIARPHRADRDKNKRLQVEDKSLSSTLLHAFEGMGLNEFPNVLKAGVEAVLQANPEGRWALLAEATRRTKYPRLNYRRKTDRRR